MGYNTDTIKRLTSLSDIAAQNGVKLYKSGREYVGLCPFHSEKTPSFQIFIGHDGHQHYHCKGCGAHGDVISFIEDLKGVSFTEACAILGGEQEADTASIPNISSLPESAIHDIYEGIEPVPIEDHPFKVGEWQPLYNPKRAAESGNNDDAFRKIKPSLVHDYRDANGKLYGLVLRADLPGGRKETPMVRHVRLPDGRTVWSRFPFTKPRPLYGLESLRPEISQVILVEGEKARDHLMQATNRCVLSWPGGTNGARHVDWSPLKGKDVILWPDHDEPGYKAMLHGDDEARKPILPIAQMLGRLGCKIRWVDISKQNWPEPLPKGFDAADLDYDKAAFENLMRACLTDWQEIAERAEAPIEAAPIEQQPLEPAPARISDTQSVAEGIDTDIIPQPDPDWMHNLTFNKDGALVKHSTNNHLSYLEHHESLKGVISYNAFALRTMLVERPPWDWMHKTRFEPRPIEDADYPRLAQYMEQAFGLTPKPKALEMLVDTVAKANSYDPLEDYLFGLRWDGIPRAANLLSDYFGSKESTYTNIISRRFLISAVARALNPGCKMDTMLILEGPQGARKSSGIRALFGEDFFSDHISDVESKDAMMEQQGIWCLEVGEMHSFTKKEANAVKKFMTQQVDRFRPPYGRNIITAPRRSLMVGTINPDGAPYLKDPTGARRFWPVMTDRVQREKIEVDRDQIWAEAVCMYQSGNVWWIQEEEQDLLQAQQQARTSGDIWEGVLAASVKYNATSAGYYELKDAIAALNLPIDRATNLHFDRIAKVLRKLGWKLVAGSTTEFEKVAG
ncbi:VapE domain-containing protein [Cohaesibacter gelatinilyticus]|nr:VapE domain-containing protein [Cohaesibacter gelatinilyticus]